MDIAHRKRSVRRSWHSGAGHGCCFSTVPSGTVPNTVDFRQPPSATTGGRGPLDTFSARIKVKKMAQVGNSAAMPMGPAAHLHSTGLIISHVFVYLRAKVSIIWRALTGCLYPGAVSTCLSIERNMSHIYEKCLPHVRILSDSSTVPYVCQYAE